MGVEYGNGGPMPAPPQKGIPMDTTENEPAPAGPPGTAPDIAPEVAQGAVPEPPLESTSEEPLTGGPADGGAESGMHPFWRVLLYGIAIAFGGFAGMLVFSIPFLLVKAMQTGVAFDEDLDPVPADLMIVGQVGIYLVVTLLTFIFARSVDRRTLRNLGFPRERWATDLMWGAVLGVGFIAVNFLAYLALGWVRFEPVAPRWDLWVIATLLLYPMIGLTEEVVFRGYLLKNFEEWKGPTFAFAATTVLFWLLHLGQGNVHEPVGILGMLSVGAAFALFRYATGALWFPIGLHAAYDWAVISFGGYEPGVEFPGFFRTVPTVPHWLVGPPGHGGLADLFFAVLLLGIAAAMYRKSRRSVASI